MNTDDLVKLLDELGQRLTPAAQYAFQLAVKQQIIDGLYAAAVIVFVLVVSVVLIVAGTKLQTAHNREDILTFPDLLQYVGVTLLCFWFIGVLVAGNDMLTRILNPEYAALRDLMATVTGNK